MDLKRLAIRVAHQTTAMPVVRSNKPLDQIRPYVELFESLDLPVNLFISDHNVVPTESTYVYPADEAFNFLAESIQDQAIDKSDKLDDINDFISQVSSSQINIICNRSSDKSFSQAGPEWLAHDIFHTVENLVYTRSQRVSDHIPDFVREDVIIEPIGSDQTSDSDQFRDLLNNRAAENLFFYWLPESFKQNAPAFHHNIQIGQINDLLPDIMLSFLTNPQSTSGFQIDYKPVFVSKVGYLTTQKNSMTAARIVPRPNADSVQQMIDLLLQDLYSTLRRELGGFVGKVLTIG